VVDDLVRRLRSKMKKLNINTIYGYGYRLLWKIKLKNLYII
jgi:two-component system response regulator CssR